MAERIPIFPLGTVLYPGLLLPLHIFEERYRMLVADLVALPEGKPKRFGVVAIREGREVGADGVLALHPVGCSAELRQVEAYPDGRFDITTTGTTRFVMRDLDQSAAYLRADVDWLGEEPGEEAAVLAGPVARLFSRYRRGLMTARADPGGDEEEAAGLELPMDRRVLSYLVAAAMVLDLSDKQALLEAPTVSDRLTMELGLLRREAAILRRLPSLPAVDLPRTPYGLN